MYSMYNVSIYINRFKTLYFNWRNNSNFDLTEFWQLFREILYILTFFTNKIYADKKCYLPVKVVIFPWNQSMQSS